MSFCKYDLSGSYANVRITICRITMRRHKIWRRQSVDDDCPKNVPFGQSPQKMIKCPKKMQKFLGTKTLL